MPAVIDYLSFCCSRCCCLDHANQILIHPNSLQYVITTTIYSLCLLTVKPKFTCDDEVFAYERKVNVVIACRVVADPVLTNYSVFWEKHTEGNKTMRPGESDGHYKADIQNGVREFNVVETAKKVSSPANTKHLYNIYTMLDQRRRRWADVV